MRRRRQGEGDDRQLGERLARIEAAVGRIEQQLEHEALPGAEAARRLEAIAAATATVAALPPVDELVSVVMPTRNRAGLLPAAVDSVLAQSHERWELLVVDDGSTDATPDVLAGYADPRVRALSNDGPTGAEAARNVALGAARGELVAYLDDDNLMGPHWLRAVAWAFASNPEAEVGYGARAIDLPSYPAPWIQFEPWGRERLRTVNYIDQNALAHRTGIDGARLDPGARFGGDWELVLRLTAARVPVAIPVVAAVYRAGAADRLTEHPDARKRWLEIQQDALRRWPLRLLVLDLLGEGDGLDAERRALEDEGAAVAVVGEPPAAGGYASLEDAVRDFDPTAIAVRAGAVPEDWFARIVRLRRPFYLRPPAGSELPVPDHPLCAGAFEAPGPGFRDRLLPALDRVRAFQAELPIPS